jgi:two-component sensor histidine kinase
MFNGWRLGPEGLSPMSAPSMRGKASVLPKPRNKCVAGTARALQERIRQQEILAKLGVTALQGASLDQLLMETARLAADGLRIEFCNVLEHVPSENRLCIRAGVGWEPGVIGVVSFGADLDSAAGFALRTGKPVISNHLQNEARFRTPGFFRRHGVRRVMNVILQGDGRPFGVLEVDSCSEGKFEQSDLAFLQGAAALLGMAIERERNERRLKAELERGEALLKETNHRVKNSLAIVASMLRSQARDADNNELAQHLNGASNHVVAIGKVHDQLAHGTDVKRMDIGKYIEAVCKDLDESVAQCDVRTDVERGIEIETDRAVSTALIINELITNAAKHAYRGETGGKILIRVQREEPGKLVISVRDKGVGAPVSFDPRKSKGLGMRIIASLAQQLHANIKVLKHTPGTEFILSMPLRLP